MGSHGGHTGTRDAYSEIRAKFWGPRCDSSSCIMRAKIFGFYFRSGAAPGIAEAVLLGGDAAKFQTAESRKDGKDVSRHIVAEWERQILVYLLSRTRWIRYPYLLREGFIQNWAMPYTRHLPIGVMAEGHDSLLDGGPIERSQATPCGPQSTGLTSLPPFLRHSRTYSITQALKKM